MGHHNRIGHRLRHGANRIGHKLRHDGNRIGHKLKHANKEFDHFAKKADVVGRKIQNSLLKAAPIIEGVAGAVSLATGQPEIAMGVTAGLEAAKHTIKTGRTALKTVTDHKQQFNSDMSKSLAPLNSSKDKFV